MMQLHDFGVHERPCFRLVTNVQINYVHKQKIIHSKVDNLHHQTLQKTVHRIF